MVSTEEQRRAKPVMPLLRWAGSKRQLLPRLLPLWDRAQAVRYIEPFVGSAALFFAASPESAILSDRNGELIRMYRTIRKDPDGVAATMAQFRRDKRTYLRLRREDPTQMEQKYRAARFLFLNRHCFNGLYRTNLLGEFNVPYAPAKAGEPPDLGHIRAAAERLRRARLFSGDFESVIKSVVAPGDFVYMDPPYAVANRRIFRQYSATTFGFEDLHRLSALLYAIDRLGAYFVLSYAICTESLRAFEHWGHIRVTTQRNIAGFAAHRRRSAELVVTNIPFE